MFSLDAPCIFWGWWGDQNTLCYPFPCCLFLIDWDSPSLGGEIGGLGRIIFYLVIWKGSIVTLLEIDSLGKIHVIECFGLAPLEVYWQNVRSIAFASIAVVVLGIVEMSSVVVSWGWVHSICNIKIKIRVTIREECWSVWTLRPPPLWAVWTGFHSGDRYFWSAGKYFPSEWAGTAAKSCACATNTLHLCRWATEPMYRCQR